MQSQSQRRVTVAVVRIHIYFIKSVLFPTYVSAFRIGDSDAEIVGGVDSTDFGSDAVLRQPIIYPKTWIWTDIQLE